MSTIFEAISKRNYTKFEVKSGGMIEVEQSMWIANEGGRFSLCELKAAEKPYGLYTLRDFIIKQSIHLYPFALKSCILFCNWVNRILSELAV